MPAFEVQKKLMDIWLEAFKHTPLLMNFDQEKALAYGTEHGAGWRLDCWGDMRVSDRGALVPHAGFLSAADRARRDSGRVAAQSGVARDLLGAGRLEAKKAMTWITSSPRRCAGTSRQ